MVYKASSLYLLGIVSWLWGSLPRILYILKITDRKGKYYKLCEKENSKYRNFCFWYSILYWYDQSKWRVDWVYQKYWD